MLSALIFAVMAGGLALNIETIQPSTVDAITTPFSASTDTLYPPVETSASDCIPPNAWCGVEANWQGGVFAFRELTSLQECWDFCLLQRRWGVCNSFMFSGSTCWIYDKAARDVTRKEPGTGLRIWDKECWECENTTTKTTPTATHSAPSSTSSCLSPTAVCEKEGRWKGGEDLKPYGYGEGRTYPLGCWEFCTDGRRPSSCKAFSWNPVTQQCLLYRQSANATHITEEGSGIWVWDLECWTCGVTGYI